MSGYDVNELQRRLANVISLGVVEAVDYTAATARVRIGGLLTAPLAMRAARAGGNRSWHPLEIGEQVIVAAPSGDLATAVIVGTLYSDAAPAPGDRAGVERVVYGNGAVIEYDRDANHFTMQLAGGSVTLVAAGGVAITGTVTVAGDVIADGISLKAHVHGGVVPGPATTGAPQ